MGGLLASRGSPALPHGAHTMTQAPPITLPHTLRPTLLCFAGDLWDGNPHSRHHLMRRYAERYEVLFVEGVPMRSVARGDRRELRRVWRKLRSGANLRTVQPGLHVLRPFPIPPSGRVGRWLQLAALVAQIRWARHKLELRGPLLSWFSLPVAAPLLGRFGELGSILYYQDRYEAFSHVNASYLRACLKALAHGCDVAVVSAEELGADLRSLGAAPVLVPHGVDVARFAGAPPMPTDLEALPGPLVGYVGLIDDYLDLELLVHLADGLQKGTLVLVGGANTDVSMLHHDRIKLLGVRPYESIPAYIANFDCCLIPFQVNLLTIAVNPIKLREYLAAGRPVVSTPLPEVEQYGDVVTIASREHFVGAVIDLLNSSDSEYASQGRRLRVADESWDRAAATIEALFRPLLSPPETDS
jgi:glycosyltransferase involved in cell wall biosynthesis